MKQIESNSVDMIFCDLPYGTTKCAWDVIIPFEPMWEQYNRIIKPNGSIVLFGQEPFSSMLRLSNLKDYKYDWYWEKERLTNIAQVKRRAGKTVETISVFYKKQCTYNPQMIEYDGKPRSNKVKNGKMGMLTDSQEKSVVEYVDTGKRYPTQVLRFQRDILTSNIHPTQKPLDLCRWIVRTYTNECDLVLDNTCGAGTIPLAATLEGRNYIGMDNGICEKPGSQYDGRYWADISTERIRFKTQVV